MGLFERLFRKEIEETKEQGRNLRIVAVTGPGGVSGTKDPGDAFWTASIMLTAWRLCDASAPVHEELRRLTMETDEEKLKWLQRMIRKDSVVRLQVREIAGGFELEEVLESYCMDVEMLEICRRQQEPVCYKDAMLGTFALNKATGAYEKMFRRQGMEVRLIIEASEEGKMQLALETARVLTANLEFWAESAGTYAANQLLELKNESWREEEEPLVTQEAFLASIWLNDIQAMPGGNFRLWYSDGGLFGGHAVYVDGNIYGRFSRAGI